MRRRIVLGMVGAVVVASAGGCNSGLVTGYQPRRLGDSPAARRAYYAGKFTPEARAAEQERAEELRTRRPTPGAVGPRAD
jgi:hypothetical protein